MSSAKITFSVDELLTQYVQHCWTKSQLLRKPAKTVMVHLIESLFCQCCTWRVEVGINITVG